MFNHRRSLFDVSCYSCITTELFCTSQTGQHIIIESPFFRIEFFINNLPLKKSEEKFKHLLNQKHSERQ